MSWSLIRPLLSTMSALQVSTVSSRLAEAVLNVPSLRCGLDLEDPKEWTAFNLCSSFVLKCAKHIRSLNISGRAFGVFGLLDFVCAATHVARMILAPDTMLQAAKANLMLSLCSHSVTELFLFGSFLPAMLPSSTTELYVMLVEPERCGGDFTQPEALLYHAACLQNLTKLNVHFSSSGVSGPVLLTSPIQLPCLASLDIEGIRLSAPELELSWVLQQPCQWLNLGIAIDTADLAKHAGAVAQLRQVPLSSLSLTLTIPFTPAMQSMWTPAAAAVHQRALSFQ